ncbi:MAG: PAS domain-containing protein [Alphaproteobacteria bacterium]|nr:PAS domain-containing protein [Alphaproteobacteria bacterium]
MIHPLPTIDAEFRSLDRHALGQDLCAQLSTYWFSLFDENGSVPTRGQFDPSMIAPLLPRLILLDVLHDGDLRYRLLGTDIDRLTRRPYTGMRLSEISGQGPESRIRRLYLTVLDRMCPVQVHLPYIGPSGLCDSVEQVAMPLMVPGGGTQLLSLVDFNLRADVHAADFLGDHSRRA